MTRKWHIIVPVLSILASIALGATITQSVSLTSFNAGELSPLMQSRVDFAKYRSGAQTLQNMIVRSQGPVTRRPGTKYIATVKDSNDAARLIPFEYSTTDAYILELGDEYIRFYRNGAQVTSGGNAYEVNSPWDANDIGEIQYAQDAEVMRFVHPDYPPYKLTRNSASHTDWTLSAITFEHGPFLDENTDHDITLYADGITGDVNVIADANIFDANHVGALWQITHLVDSESIRGRFAGPWYAWDVNAYDESADGAPYYDANSEMIRVYKDQTYSVTTADAWYGVFKIQRSYDDGVTWNTVKTFAYQGNGNVLYTGREEEDDAYYRVRIENQYITGNQNDHGTHWCEWTFSTDPFLRHGVVTITAYVDANEVTATVDTELASTDPTWRWAEGAWSTYRGWPRTVEHHEQRCVYGGTNSYPQTIWGSITSSQDSDYDDFDEGLGDAADAWTYVLPGMNPIQWLKSREYLMVGSSGGVGRLGTPDKPISPTWPPTYRLQARNGAAYIQPVHAVDAVLYVERGNQKVRELTYTYSSDRYIAPDMTILAEHITGPGITQIAFQERPDPILWCVRSDGVLLSFTYQRHHEVESWSRHTTGPAGVDNFESIARIPGTNEDQIWAVVQRTIDTNSVRYVEQFQPFDWGSDQNDAWFVDCGGTNQASLTWLEGSTVKVWADARPVEAVTYTVASGILSPTASGYTNTTIGLPYTSILQTMPLVVALADGADSLGRPTRIKSLMIDFYKTLGCQVGADATYLADLKFSGDSFATTLTAFTGTKTMPYSRGTSRAPALYLQEDGPVPLCVRHIVADLEVTVE